MNKHLIGTLVGGLILFIWQFISWGMFSFHGNEMKYTPKQDQILEALAAIDLEEGAYMVPSVAPDKMAERDALMEPYLGKPWARVSYQKNLDMNMSMNMVRGIIIDFLAAFFLVWILMNFEDKGFKNCLMASLAVGAIGYLTIPYLNTIWFKTDSMGYLIDAIGCWGLVGVFLGWFLNRK